jgi:hypothetical protein
MFATFGLPVIQELNHGQDVVTPFRFSGPPVVGGEILK